MPPTTCGPPPQTTGLISASPESQPSSSEAKTQLSDFTQIPQNPPRTLPVLTSFTSPGLSISGFYFDISEWHILPARAWTPALIFHLTNPCTKRKVLSLIKPKGKIYKTKSLGHYITHTQTYIYIYIYIYITWLCLWPWVSCILLSVWRVQNVWNPGSLKLLYIYIYIYVCVCVCVFKCSIIDIEHYLAIQ